MGVVQNGAVQNGRSKTSGPKRAVQNGRSKTGGPKVPHDSQSIQKSVNLSPSWGVLVFVPHVWDKWDIYQMSHKMWDIFHVCFFTKTLKGGPLQYFLFLHIFTYFFSFFNVLSQKLN